MKKINGYIAAPFTPMLNNGDINLELIPEYYEFIKRNGPDGVFICGSTGEGALLTKEERMVLAEKWINVSNGELKVIIHTGGANLRDQKFLANHAQQIGAWGIAAMAPAFLPPTRNEEFVLFCKSIASAAPNLPFYYYHIPPLNKFNLSILDFLKTAENEIPNLAGVKFTDFNIHEFDQCRYIADGKYEMLWGLDEMFLDGLVYGNKAGVGGTYNHCFGLYLNMKKAFSQNDMEKCRSLQHQSHEFCTILKKYRGNIMGGKRIMKFLGLDCGPNRIPLQTTSELEEKELYEELKSIDFFEYCNN
jgi:N-acetylneuraminate lyase